MLVNSGINDFEMDIEGKPSRSHTHIPMSLAACSNIYFDTERFRLGLEVLVYLLRERGFPFIIIICCVRGIQQLQCQLEYLHALCKICLYRRK